MSLYFSIPGDHHHLRWDVSVCVPGHREIGQIEGVDGDQVRMFGQFGGEEILEKGTEVNPKDGDKCWRIQSSRETSRAHFH